MVSVKGIILNLLFELEKVTKSFFLLIFPRAGSQGSVGRRQSDINGREDFYLSRLWQHPCNCPGNMFPFPSQHHNIACSCSLLFGQVWTQSSSLYYPHCDNNTTDATTHRLWAGAGGGLHIILRNVFLFILLTWSFVSRIPKRSHAIPLFHIKSKLSNI